MFPTVRDVLGLDLIRHGAPHVVAGGAGLDRPVRWVHVAELPDIAHLLRGGELVLTTGIALPNDNTGLHRWLDDLAQVGAAGVVIELGRRFTRALPDRMRTAADELGFPLVELRRETPFVRITEAVHALIVDAQLAELQGTEEIHQRFTELSVEGADAAEVVRQTALLAGAPVVLENPARQVLAYDPAGEDGELLLDGWESFSRSLPVGGRTTYDPSTGWLSTLVGARGHDWGRLLVRVGTPPLSRQTILVERAAATIAIDRLVRRDEDVLEHQAHRTLLAALLDGGRPAAEIAIRAKALGVPLEHRRLLGVVVRARGSGHDAPPGPAQLRDLSAAVSAALVANRQVGLCGVVSDSAVGVLLAMAANASAADEARAMDLLAGAVHRAGRRTRLAPDGLVIGMGSTVAAIRDARRSLVEAGQVAEAARCDHRSLPYYRLPDVGLRGLLHLLRDDSRMQSFVERELGPLLAYQARQPREDLIGTLRAYLESGRNKTLAARATHLSRQALYDRLTRICGILGVDLDSPTTCLSLHVALLARDAGRHT